jgi:uncharacterized membrane protein YagU involved in acid resistance
MSVSPFCNSALREVCGAVVRGTTFAFIFVTMQEQMKSMTRGAIAGALATVPMSALMLAGKRWLPWHKRDPLPPARIISEATKAVGLHDDLRHEQRMALAAVSHFGYGAAMGGVYSQVTSAQSPAAATASGVAFGLGVWTASYLGLMPALGLYRSATQEPAERNTLMIAAHMVWGASVGLTLHYLMKPSHAKHRSPSRRPGRRVRHRLRRQVSQ